MVDTLFQFFREIFFFAAYVSTNTSFPEPLKPEEEAKYLKRCAKGDEDARTKLIEHNLRLVAHIAKKYTTAGRDSDDVISIGTIGLIKAVSTYKINKGTTLATYAARCIENEILMYFRSQKKLQGEVSLSDSIEADNDGDALQLMDVVGVDDTMLEDLYDRDNARRLHQLVRERLSVREAEIIRLRYGLGGTLPLTQREVASSFGISRSYVSRIEKRALEKLKAGLEESEAKKQRSC